MAINILKNEHFHSIGTYEGTPTLEKLKEQALSWVLELEPILTRSFKWYDHLVEFDPQSDPPKLRWKVELLKQSSIEYLIGVKTLLEKAKEEQTKKY